MVRAFVLISGGLDSALAAKLLLEQKVKVIGIVFTSYFFSPVDRSRVLAKELQIPLITLDISEEHLNIVLSPPHGYGKNMNPCIDCHALMLKKAKALMAKYNVDFIATGEVLGERTMSQNRNSLHIVEKEAGLNGMVLRPLSAGLLSPTFAERMKMVDRTKLLSISGKSRKEQLRLASEYGISGYSTPAGGCLLTDPGYSRRLRDLVKHDEAYGESVKLLKFGRHFRVNNSKIIIGRNEDENLWMEKFSEDGYTILRVEAYEGPITLVTNSTEQVISNYAVPLTIRYSDAPKDQEIIVICGKSGKMTKIKGKSMTYETLGLKPI